MPTPQPEDFLLAAKHAEVASLDDISEHLQWVSSGCNVIHQLQRERGLTNIWLVSTGQRKNAELTAQRINVEHVIAQFNEGIAPFCSQSDGRLPSALLTALAQATLALASLDALRRDIDAQQRQPLDSTLAYNHMVKQLLALLAEVAELTRNPTLAKAIIALLYLVQMKEKVGQERAWTSIGFARGYFVERLQQRLHHNQSQQAELLEAFLSNASPEQSAAWQTLAQSNLCQELVQIRQMRDALYSREDNDPGIADPWYEKITEYIDQLYALEQLSIKQLADECCFQRDQAERERIKIAKQLVKLQDQPPEDPMLSGGDSPATLVLSTPSLHQLISEQSLQIQHLQADLSRAKHALQSRKLVERAKDILKGQLKLDDDAAYKQLQQSAMSSGRTLEQVAQRVVDMLQQKGGATR